MDSLDIRLSKESDPPKEVEKQESIEPQVQPKKKKKTWKEYGYTDNRDRTGRKPGKTKPGRNSHGPPKYCVCDQKFAQWAYLQNHQKKCEKYINKQKQA